MSRHHSSIITVKRAESALKELDLHLASMNIRMAFAHVRGEVAGEASGEGAVLALERLVSRVRLLVFAQVLHMRKRLAARLTRVRARRLVLLD